MVHTVLCKLPTAVFPALPVLGGSSPFGSVRYSLMKWSLSKGAYVLKFEVYRSCL